MKIPESELILNPDGSIYHLNLRPEDIANTIIFVGDPDRVAKVSKYFDRIEVKKQKREFITHTGYIGKKKMTVLSTGIGGGNIDIVMNELDALVNIDLEKSESKKEHTALDIIRMGTTGGLNPDIPLGDIVLSKYGVGFDAILNFYKEKPKGLDSMENNFLTYTKDLKLPIPPYFGEAGSDLINKLGKNLHKGITITCGGFYAPQGRDLRLKSYKDSWVNKLSGYSFNGFPVTNFEMETATIYGLSNLLGHNALSTSTILADRINDKFHPEPKKAVETLIKVMLERIEAS